MFINGIEVRTSRNSSICIHSWCAHWNQYFALCGNRCGTIVSGDSSGGVQFWDGQFGTLLQAHSYHKGYVNALAVAPNHNRVFSAGSDGQVYSYYGLIVQFSYLICDFSILYFIMVDSLKPWLHN